MHIFSIDILRGLAALAVAWYHFICGKEGFIGKGFVLSSGELGWLGYEVFFIISGFAFRTLSIVDPIDCSSLYAGIIMDSFI